MRRRAGNCLIDWSRLAPLSRPFATSAASRRADSTCIGNLLGRGRGRGRRRDDPREQAAELREPAGADPPGPRAFGRARCSALARGLDFERRELRRRVRAATTRARDALATASVFLDREHLLEGLVTG